MAIKDWKKDKNVRIWHNIKTKEYIEIYDHSKRNDNKAVDYGKVSNPKFKKFKHRTSALKFVKAYMKKN